MSVGTGANLVKIRAYNLDLVKIRKYSRDAAILDIARAINDYLYPIFGANAFAYCSEYDLGVAKIPDYSKIVGIRGWHVRTAKFETIEVESAIAGLALSPSPHPDLSTIFTEVKFMLNDVGFILSTDDGIHFALSWESES